MSAADRIERLCISAAAQACGDTEASTELTMGVASALAAVIAVTLAGLPDASDRLARVIADGLPEMVARRAQTVRAQMHSEAGTVQ
ncbi:hypothetical protein MKK84_32850 [Methylobacterium sp. E-065]|uniref:hypothetical protein n=1 Tax=Methylobacterium sp. E-065 TaxID=2836583 RepID=UPI001FBA289C|nr:hypothetical protein [Methylobacterium sp. E-065]MCJ2022138.1 hypothetical protein [Methylobacterium sp. E-065]